MRHIKTYDSIDLRCYKKFKVGDFVFVLGNKYPAIITEVNYDDPYLQYYCVFLPDRRRQFWYHERYLIRKLENWEIEALKYNL